MKEDDKPEKATLPTSTKLDTTAHASPSFTVHSTSWMDGGWLGVRRRGKGKAAEDLCLGRSSQVQTSFRGHNSDHSPLIPQPDEPPPLP